MPRALQPPFSRLAIRILDTRPFAEQYYYRSAKIYAGISATMLVLTISAGAYNGWSGIWPMLVPAAIILGNAFQMYLAARHLGKGSTNAGG